MVATACIHPADLVKTRMQVIGQNGSKVSAMDVARGIVQSEGVKGLYDGLSASVIRQMVSSGARLGCFNAMFDWHEEKYGHPSLGTKVVMGSTAGMFSALISMPLDVALVRMTTDGRLPKYKRKNYKNVFNCIYRLAQVEGILVLTKGLVATVSRSMILNATQLAAYTQAREVLLPHHGDGLKLHFIASLIAGLITTVIGQPVDMIKTRIQESQKKETQLKVLMEIIKREGVLAFWMGFIPSYLKVAPHTVITFILLEQMNTWYFNYCNK